MTVEGLLIPSKGAVELGSNEANTPAYSAGGLTRGTLHVPNQLDHAQDLRIDAQAGLKPVVARK
eukprot:1058076-Pyramimonas_sp.AAC.1